MREYKTPGVYVEEIPKLPPSIASVETAIPAFIGYTEKAQWKEKDDLLKRPWRITSLLQYEQYFGFPDPEKEGSLSAVFTNNGQEINGKVDETKRSKFLMYYSLQMFFANGGGPCWIVSIGDYQKSGGTILPLDLKSGLNEVAKINEVTLLLFPDAINIEDQADYYDVHKEAIDQAVLLQDRFVLMDVFHVLANLTQWDQDVAIFRTAVASSDNLKYAAAYFPFIKTLVDFNYKVPGDQTTDNDAGVMIEGVSGAQTLADLKARQNAKYFQAKNAVSRIPMVLPASVAMAGIYAQIDNSRGVWKAPANINIDYALEPLYLITNKEQEDLNVDAEGGKSINVIRKFEGRGAAIVWGARTLLGNSNEWRYISVRRYFNMVEESVKNATQQFVFEPNDENTWVRVKSMIQNYLGQQWKAGALMGASVKEAYYVHVGLGETMTELDIWEGRMIIEIGMAVVRPAEFIILKFMHKMLQES